MAQTPRVRGQNSPKPGVFEKFQKLTKELQHDEDQILLNESRYIGGLYMPVRMKAQFSEINDKNKSDLPSQVLRPSDVQKAQAHQEYVKTFRAKRNDIFQTSPDSVCITNWSK